MKTIDVKILVTEVLTTFPKYTEHVVDEVFHAIEENETWYPRYLALCDELGKVKVNIAGGKWIAKAVGKPALREVPTRLSKLLNQYSILDMDVKSVFKKPVAKKATVKKSMTKNANETEARKIMSDYYMANKQALHPKIREHSKKIIELILGGTSVAEAFDMVVNK